MNPPNVPRRDGKTDDRVGRKMATLKKLEQPKSRPISTKAKDWDLGALSELVDSPAEVVKTDKEVLIYNSLGKMSKTMEDDAVAIAKKAIQEAPNNLQMACYITLEFEKKYETKWHCIVGTDFASDVTTNMGMDLLFFRVGPLEILLFKTA